MSRRPPVPVPAYAADATPTYRYWGNKKPPKNALILCQATPRLSADATKATIRLYGPIDPYGGIWGTSSKEVAAALDGLDDTVTELQLRINSPGGSPFEGLAILNLLRAHPVKVTAVVDGVAASAASFVAAGCDVTIMSPGTQMMIHGPSGLCWGMSADMRETADVLDKIAASMASLYVEAAGGSPADWLKIMETDTWYTAEEAVEAKLADQVAVVPDAGQTATAGAPPDDDEDDDLEPDELDDPEALATRYAEIAASYTTPAHHTPPTASAGGSIPTQEGSPAVAFSDEQVTTMRQQLGIAEDADEATILAALTEALDERSDPSPAASTTAQIPEGMALVDSTLLEELKTGAAAGQTAQTTLASQERDRVIDQALKDGKIAATSRERFVEAWDKDQVSTTAILDALTPGVVPTSEVGHENEPNALGDIEISDAELDAFAASLGLNKEALRG